MTSRRLYVLLFALALAPAPLSLGNEVQEVDPAQYADVASRMLRSGEFLSPRDTFGPHLNKPPLMMWTQAACMALLGEDSFAARLPALLYGLLAAWAVFRIGRLLRDQQLGALAACLFAASTAFQLMVADPKVDMPLTAMTALAIWAVLESRQRPHFLWAGWVFAGLAVLAKGPLGVVLPVLALAPVALRADWSAEPRSFLSRVFALKPVRGLGIVAALAAGYYVSVALKAGTGATFDLIWRTQGFGRVLGQTDWVGTTTPAFYLHTGLWAFLPGSPLVVFGVVRRVLARVRGAAPGPLLEVLPLAWLFVPMAVLSVPSYKLPQHIYCLAPAAALLAAQELVALSDLAHRWFRFGYAALSAAAAGAVAVALVVVFPTGAPRLLGWCGLLLAMLVGALVAARRLPAVERTGLYALAALSGFFVYFHAGFQPALLEYQPWQEIGQRIRTVDPTGRSLHLLGDTWNFAISFYARRECWFPTTPDFVETVKKGEAQYAVVPDDTLEPLRALGVESTLIERYPRYPTSTAKLDFLRASTRPSTLGWVNLVEVRMR